MKKKLLSLFLILGIFVGAVYNVPAQAAETIKISKTKKTIYVGDKYTLKLKGAPSGAKITWKTSDKSIATVSKKGKVTGVSNGKATITATYNKKSYTCTVTVKKYAYYKTISTFEKNNFQKVDGNYQEVYAIPDDPQGSLIWAVYYPGDKAVQFGITGVALGVQVNAGLTFKDSATDKFTIEFKCNDSEGKTTYYTGEATYSIKSFSFAEPVKLKYTSLTGSKVTDAQAASFDESMNQFTAMILYTMEFEWLPYIDKNLTLNSMGFKKLNVDTLTDYFGE